MPIVRSAASGSGKDEGENDEQKRFDRARDDCRGVVSGGLCAGDVFPLDEVGKENRMEGMFQYVFAGYGEVVRRSSQQELDRFVEWAQMQPVSDQILGALVVVDRAVRLCGPLSFEHYQAVCGAAAALAYVAINADNGFDWLWAFFRDMPRLFQIEWSWSLGPVEAE